MATGSRWLPAEVAVLPGLDAGQQTAPLRGGESEVPEPGPLGVPDEHHAAGALPRGLEAFPRRAVTGLAPSGLLSLLGAGQRHRRSLSHGIGTDRRLARFHWAERDQRGIGATCFCGL